MEKRYALRKRILVTEGAGFIGSHLCRRMTSVV
jgi:nucleoside-diphosphate-sugar epimerase